MFSLMSLSKSFQQILWQKVNRFFSRHSKTPSLKGFYFKANRKALGSSKKQYYKFSNGLPLSAYFYVTITGKFEHTH